MELVVTSDRSGSYIMGSNLQIGFSTALHALAQACANCLSAVYSATVCSMMASTSLLESSITSATSSGIIGRKAETFIREMKTSPWLSW